jgi:endonuclease/exonuclease/phosphatase family metal-dependent hydrolase
VNGAVISGVIALRVMTYNIHSCKGMDGRIRPDRIAQVIAKENPDVVALQEVRVGRVDPKEVDHPKKGGNAGIIEPPVGEYPLPPASVIPPRTLSNVARSTAPYTDQPGSIADALGYYHIFYPLVRMGKEDYGIALLSRYPLHLVRAANLPTLPKRPLLERRGAIWAEIKVGSARVQILNTHLGLNEKEKLEQVEALLGRDWMRSEKFTGAYVLCGDLNSSPHEKPYRHVANVALDAVKTLGKTVRQTWPSLLPVRGIDHVFIPPSAHATRIAVPWSRLTMISSDHLPLVADLKIPIGE